VLLLVFPLAAAAQEGPQLASETPPKISLSGVFQFFSDLTKLPYLPFQSKVKPPAQHLYIRQSGDPDSVISPGAPTPSNQVSLKPSFEINDILLKAYTPDPTLSPGDNRFRAAGAFSPIDEHGRPYQFTLGARLVW